MEFRQVKKKSKQLFIYANSVIVPLFRQMSVFITGVVLLFDKSGCLLRLYGEEHALRWADGLGVRSGAKWTEDSMGANIFTAGVRRENGTVMVGQESYAQFLEQLAFYFAPIQIEGAETYGGIALMVPANQQSETLQTLALAVARSIELQFFWFSNTNLHTNMQEGSGMLSLDRSSGKNHVQIISTEVMKMLEIPPGDFYYEELENIIDPPPANRIFWDIVENETVVTDTTIRLAVKGKTHVVSISSYTFQEKRLQSNGITFTINSIQRINRLVSQYSGNAARYTFDDIIGESEGMDEVIRRGRIAAQNDSNILLQGESGVGKDIFAQAVHNASQRSSKPFVAINCAAFSKELIASELFGYESGAFTGAKKEGGIGKFELATGGTLFLDEIGDMPLDLQAILLRVLEERCFRKVGGNTLVHVDVRIIAATNQRLSEKIAQGLFREDLFYRLGIIRLNIPPLRHRGQDILLLSEHFIAQICTRLGKKPVRLSAQAAAFALEYPWPGNVREMRNLLEGLISTTEEHIITEKDIQQYLEDYTNALHTPSYAKPRQPAPVLSRRLPSYTREDFLDALRVCGNNRSQAAQYLNLSRSTFYRRLQAFEKEDG